MRSNQYSGLFASKVGGTSEMFNEFSNVNNRYNPPDANPYDKISSEGYKYADISLVTYAAYECFKNGHFEGLGEICDWGFGDGRVLQIFNKVFGFKKIKGYEKEHEEFDYVAGNLLGKSLSWKPNTDLDLRNCDYFEDNDKIKAKLHFYNGPSDEHLGEFIQMLSAGDMLMLYYNFSDDEVEQEEYQLANSIKELVSKKNIKVLKDKETLEIGDHTNPITENVILLKIIDPSPRVKSEQLEFDF